MTGCGVIDEAAAMLGAMAERDVPLAPLTTYRVGGPAALMARPRSIDDLHTIGAAIAATGLPVLVIGRGSNLLVADSGFVGIAVLMSEIAGEHDVPNDYVVERGRAAGDTVVAGASMALPQLARRLVAEALTGFEWAVGVPGSIGGAVRMNAGGHGSDMQACLSDVLLHDLRRQWTGWVAADRLGLRFRGSDLATHQLVIEARLQLAHGDQQSSGHVVNEIVRWRRENQPGGQNCGSVFVNPIPGELSAGELVERAGLRGFALASASVSAKHANFILASDGGTSADVRALIEHVRRRVADETGFELRSEVRLVGFDDIPLEDERGVQL